MWVVDAHWEGVGDGKMSLEKTAFSNTPCGRSPRRILHCVWLPGVLPHPADPPRVGGLPPPKTPRGRFGGRQLPNPGGPGGREHTREAKNNILFFRGQRSATTALKSIPQIFQNVVWVGAPVSRNIFWGGFQNILRSSARVLIKMVAIC